MGFALHGIEEARETHAAIAARTRDLSPLLEQLRAEVEEMIDRAWVQRTSPGGDRWEDLRGESESRGGRLRREVDVRVEGDEIVIEVLVDHASWQFFGTSTVPARNPLPVEPRGNGLEWMDRGAAGAWLRALPERTERYLVTGEVTP